MVSYPENRGKLLLATLADIIASVAEGIVRDVL